MENIGSSWQNKKDKTETQREMCLLRHGGGGGGQPFKWPGAKPTMVPLFSTVEGLWTDAGES